MTSSASGNRENQRPELWNLYNTRIRRGEHIRVFPLSNWTELDIWHYIAREEQLEIPSIYFAHQRQVFERDGILLADNEFVTRQPTDEPPVFDASVRYRTVGDMTCTGAVESVGGVGIRRGSLTKSRPRGITERGQTRSRTTGQARRHVKTGSGRATSDDGLRLAGRAGTAAGKGGPAHGHSAAWPRRATGGRREEHPESAWLLYDSKAIFEDQLAAVERTSRERGEQYTNLALCLTDGLRAEREQGITIDVAYRYFATPRRKFIIADTPGHIQYTRNMVTGASSADLAIVLVDARNGLTEQSRRHAFLATLLQVPHLVLAVNKMDLVDYQCQRV